MGRYYSGDIEGKFWFGVQGSEDAEFFGAVGTEPNTIDYYVEDLKEVQKGLKKCQEKLRGYKRDLDKFFDTHPTYSYKELTDTLRVTERKAEELLTWYARQELGKKIEKCIKEQGYCGFEAEL